ncbi:minichromosome maintenance- protein [Desmophyllum pertusum]|uniref:Minichromosome maintenance- protein n=1 Tax=Desmophyllum pertusum TaxID=174260 RepID=A0A9X0CHU6_9CNID|nr:minichromosome maintenance- protein [Desmophyllum pertusum]
MSEDMEDQDLDDLDLLACLVDSDSEFLDDDNFGEAISASNVSPQSTTTTTSVTQPQQPHETWRTICNDIKFNDRRNGGRHDITGEASSALSTLYCPYQLRASSPESSTLSRSSTKQKVGKHPSTLKKKPTDGLESKGSKTASSLGPRGKKTTDRELVTSKKKATNEVETRTRTSNDDENFSKDKFSSLRIINPLISSVVMEKRMEGRRMVTISQIPTKIKGNNEIDGDWVTIGVIVNKLPPKKSANGNTYGIWKLSDLGSDTANDCVALFLFGDVYKEHWKTTEGSVIALLNASLLPAKETLAYKCNEK